MNFLHYFIHTRSVITNRSCSSSFARKRVGFYKNFAEENFNFFKKNKKINIRLVKEGMIVQATHNTLGDRIQFAVIG